MDFNCLISLKRIFSSEYTLPLFLEEWTVTDDFSESYNYDKRGGDVEISD